MAGKRDWNIVIDDGGDADTFVFRTSAREEDVLKRATDAYRRRTGIKGRAVIAHLVGDDEWLTGAPRRDII